MAITQPETLTLPYELDNYYPLARLVLRENLSTYKGGSSHPDRSQTTLVYTDLVVHLSWGGWTGGFKHPRVDGPGVHAEGGPYYLRHR